MGREAANKDGLRRAPAPRKVVPTGALTLLVLAFGGALTLKAIDERQSADESLLAQQSREALAVASHVRAELVAARARMEGLLLTGASLDAIRKGVPFDAVGTRPSGEGGWAQITDENGIRVLAKDPAGQWVSGLLPSHSILPAATGGRTLYLRSIEQAPQTPMFQQAYGKRFALACAPIADAGVAACVSRPSPLLGLGDLRRLVIYAMLLAAPLLAVIGLLQTIKRLKKPEEDPSAIARRSLSAPAPTDSKQFEVSGLIGFWSWDRATETLTLSEQAASMLGAPRAGDMTLDEFITLIDTDEHRKIRNGIERADPMSPVNLVFQPMGHRAGSWLEMVGGAAPSGFAGALLNVTDRINAERRSRRAEQLARTALEAYPGPFAVWDSRRRLTHWNTAFARVFNLDKSVMQVGASYDHVMTEVARFVRVERPLGDEGNVREMLLISDQWISFVDRRTANDGLISVGIDITTLKRQETNLSRSEKRLRSIVSDLERTRGQAQELAQKYAEQKARAERASKAKSVFLANMSHELRTPLNAINGFSEMLASQVYGPLGDARYKGYAEDILASGQHLLDMINDILDMAKIEAGKMQISTRMIDPAEAVDAAVRMIRRHAADKGVSLQFEADEDLPDINGDHRAIRQMTLNLVANAIKFTDAGGSIRVTLMRQGEWAALAVRDTGIGIPAEDLPRLCRPFEQAGTADGRNVQGTGLGLALTKSFAEMHGGRLEIESQVGVGTCVTVLLPIPSAEQAPPAPRTNQATTQTA